MIREGVKVDIAESALDIPTHMIRYWAAADPDFAREWSTIVGRREKIIMYAPHGDWRERMRTRGKR